MKILAVEKEMSDDIPFEQFAPHLIPETARAWELLQANVLREIYREPNTFRHVLVFECATIEEADGYVQSLPLVKYGLTSFELIALGPYPGFERLFAQQG
jgi:muconolactone delta-isomerase